MLGSWYIFVNFGAERGYLLDAKDFLSQANFGGVCFLLQRIHLPGAAR